MYLATMIGEGGFEKRVALKVLKPALSADPESVELFMREAKLAARLNHPNIVQVFDGGLDQGNLYLVLEYVDGGDLDGLIRACRKRGRPVSPVAVAQVGAQICEALCAMFDLRDEAGLPVVQAHRDISPGNVLLSRAGVIKLSDFTDLQFAICIRVGDPCFEPIGYQFSRSADRPLLAVWRQHR